MSSQRLQHSLTLRPAQHPASTQGTWALPCKDFPPPSAPPPLPPGHTPAPLSPPSLQPSPHHKPWIARLTQPVSSSLPTLSSPELPAPYAPDRPSVHPLHPPRGPRASATPKKRSITTEQPTTTASAIRKQGDPSSTCLTLNAPPPLRILTNARYIPQQPSHRPQLLRGGQGPPDPGSQTSSPSAHHNTYSPGRHLEWGKVQ